MKQTTYFLRMPAELGLELRHLCIETRRTMNSAIVEAIQVYLDRERARGTDDGNTP